MTAMATHCATGLEPLIASIREAVARHEDWEETSVLVADALRRDMPSPYALTPEQRRGDPDRYRSHTLHVEPDGSFSIVALVWLPGQETPIHDHVTWCVFGVIQGAEHEEVFVLDEEAGRLVRAGSVVNLPGDVAIAPPPGDIHRVRNAGEGVAISIHVYGTDVVRMGSSVRRVYDLPVA
jgi:predicted metal-dependent enzyme (double-stranded beta helix superfamily)